ncbi:MAG: LVIVD repeat-containing protein [Planctomycetota bacterium]|jgi:hypothetical protein
MANWKLKIGAAACLFAFTLVGAHLAWAGNGDRADLEINLKLIGHHDLGGDGWNTDVWAHGDYAYVGTWGLFGYDCLDGAVKVISLKDPANPALVETILAPPGTQTNDVKVARIDSKSFRGDVLAISNEDCAEGGARGVELWDVSDPTDPERLSRIGPEETDGSLGELLAFGFGVHNTFIWKHKGKTYLGTIIDGAEIFQFLVGFDRKDMTGDVRFYDISDPRNPVEVGDWGTVKVLGQDPFDGQGTDSQLRIPHDIWVQNGVAYVSYWDAGLILLDVSDPTDPVMLSQTQYAASEEGNTHVAVPAHGGNIVVVGDEDFTPGPWGFMRIFDTQDPTDPFELATFATANTAANPPTSVGDFSMHNVVVRGNRLYVSWYGDGVRVIDISNPATPREIGSFVPPAVADPQGFFPTAANVWGIHVHKDLILASDTNAGLYVLKQTK